jgi:hypothetical protein
MASNSLGFRPGAGGPYSPGRKNAATGDLGPPGARDDGQPGRRALDFRTSPGEPRQVLAAPGCRRNRPTPWPSETSGQIRGTPAKGGPGEA